MIEAKFGLTFHSSRNAFQVNNLSQITSFNTKPLLSIHSDFLGHTFIMHVSNRLLCYNKALSDDLLG